MQAAYTQDNRVGRLTTPLGKDELLLTRFDGVEGVNEPFEFRVEALSRKDNINFHAFHGQACMLEFHTVEGRKRFFEGMLAETQWLGVRDGLFAYRLILRPAFWLLSFGRNMRIFHNKPVDAILKEVLSSIPTDIRLNGGFPVMEYCVQYRESDFNFASRLMEQHGIAYAFSQGPGGHKLLIWKNTSSLDEIEGGPREYSSSAEQHGRWLEMFYHWIPEGRFSAGRTTFRDYDFKKPSTSLEVSETGDGNAVTKQFEIYDYPGKYVERGDGQKYAKTRMENERAADKHYFASGDCISCMPGQRLTLKNHPDAAFNKEYLILRATHTFATQRYRAVGSGASDENYHGNYEFFDADRPFAPPVVTEKPRVHGPQTAKVVGKDEIDVDEHGRITVQFHWDRTGANSCRVRVAQVWSGKNWGGIYIPRVGMEVIVDFLEGDPDAPIVIGTVYNGENKPPYPLPGQKNLAGVKSNSTTGGGGYNELVFDDTSGSELVRFHAQHNLDSTIKDDETRHVGKTLKVDVGDMIEIVCGASKLVMKKDGTITLTGKDITVTGSNDIKIKGTSSVTVEGVAQLNTKGLMVDHQGGSMMNVHAPMVKIN